MTRGPQRVLTQEQSVQLPVTVRLTVEEAGPASVASRRVPVTAVAGAAVVIVRYCRGQPSVNNRWLN